MKGAKRQKRMKTTALRDKKKFILHTLKVGHAVTRSSLEQKVLGSKLGPVKSDTVWPTACHHCNISSKKAVLPGSIDGEMGPHQLVTRFIVIQRV